MSAVVFVSYSHRDMEPVHWLERLRVYMAPFRRGEGVEIWDDSRIEPGSDWRSEIRGAVSNATAAILLVGPGFLASEFIESDELPTILHLAHHRGAVVFPLVVGYCGYRRSSLGSLQAFNDPDTPLEALPPAQQNKLLNELSMAVDDRMRKIDIARPRAELRENTGSILVEIQRQLSNSFRAFNAQSQRRDDLVEHITTRLKIRNKLQYEKFFFRHFRDMDEEERFEFNQIRALTEGPLYKSNATVLDLLSKHPLLVDRFPELADLQQHLVFWLNKYEKVFAHTPEMAVLYTGVEDAVPFPAGLDAKLRKWIEADKQVDR